MEKLVINGITFSDERTSVTFNNWGEVSDWWKKNPTAHRVSPEIKAESIEEYNKANHAIEFPCEMSFVFPEK